MQQPPVNPLPSAQPPAPERIIIQIERKTMPLSGRVVEVLRRVITREDEPGHFVTEDVVEPAAADCSCSVMSVSELVECSICHGVICTKPKHGGVCSSCGLVVCMACSTPSSAGRVCVKCTARQKRKQFYRAIIGWFVRIEDE